MPDQVPTLAALAPFASGVTRIRNVAHLRFKESNRLAVMCRELERVGVPARELADGLEVPGIWSDKVPKPSPVVIDPEGDHRIAMAFAVLGLRRGGVAIAHPEVVEKSFPAFFEELERWTRARG
jgi:3-phosphoshikimate 1-carboxyvinyltransferase